MYGFRPTIKLRNCIIIFNQMGAFINFDFTSDRKSVHKNLYNVFMVTMKLLIFLSLLPLSFLFAYLNKLLKSLTLVDNPAKFNVTRNTLFVVELRKLIKSTENITIEHSFQIKQ